MPVLPTIHGFQWIIFTSHTIHITINVTILVGISRTTNTPIILSGVTIMTIVLFMVVVTKTGGVAVATDKTAMQAIIETRRLQEPGP